MKNKIIIISTVILIVLIIVFLRNKSNNSQTENETTIAKNTVMEFPELEKKILAEEFIVEDDIAALANPDATLPLLKKYCNSKNENIRHIILSSLNVLPSLEAKHLMVKFLDDSSDEVRIEACRFVRLIDSEGIVPEVLKYLSNKDFNVRSASALAIGRLGDQNACKQLSPYYDKEKNSDVKNDISVALAKLGDENHLKLVYDKLKSNETQTILKTLSEIQFIGVAAYPENYLKLLSDERDAYRIDPRNQKHSRICDEAVKVLLKQYKHPLSLKVNERAIFSEDEIKSVISFLENEVLKK